MTTTIADRLFSELDRQLVEARTAVDGVATRAGLLTSATAIAAGLLGSRLSSIGQTGWTVATLITFGVATLFGVAAVSPLMWIGAKASVLTAWMASVGAASAPDATTRAIFAEKIVILEKNLTLLTAVRVLYSVQGLAVLVGVVLAVVSVAQVP